MANVKITELTVTTDPASTDVLPIVDVTANTTKKVTIADLLENAGNGSASTPAFAFDADPDTGMYQVATNQLGFSTAGTNRLTIDSSGNVGIGAASTSAKLHISATDSTNSPDLLFLENLGTGNNTGSTIYFRNRTGTAFTDCTIQSLGSSTNNSELLFSTEAGAGPVERMRINSSGNVGIGVSSPSAKLDVNGSAEFASTVEIGSFLSTTAAAVYLASGAVQAFRDSSVNPATSAVFIGGRKTGSGSESNVSIKAGGAATFAGAVTAQSYVTSSDQRFKENITDANSQLADVTALGNKLRNWDWTADAPVADKDTRFLGLVAQEAEIICPGIVKTIARTKQGAELTPETTDEEGNVTPATYEELDDSYKGISHDALIMKLLGAVSELSAKVAALEAG